MNENKLKKRKKRKINRIISILLLVVVLIFFSMIFYINIIPIIYTIIALIIMLALCFGLIILNFRKKKILRIIGYFFSIILIAIMLFGVFYLYNTLGFLFNVTKGDYAIKTYNILVSKESNYKKIKDLDDEEIGINESSIIDSLKEVEDNLQNKIDYEFEKYEDVNSLIEALYNDEVDAIILENSEIELLKEHNQSLYEKIESIYKIEIKNDIKDLKAAVNINKEPFNIYLSGIDTFGKINSSSRSDVNMILTVNPKSEKILITWIPRDYYVSINSSKYKDKLTHAGIYGIDSSIYGVEKLLNIDINYYVKVNFTSLIDIVDLFNGITINNEKAFYSTGGVYFKEGNINLNGEKTLTFVRERKNIAEGDVGRGKNQIKVIKALMNKAMSPSIIKNYNNLLNSLDGAFVTNMNHATMLGFIRKEIQSPRDWKIESNILSGTDSYEYTYTYKNTELYVMKPNEDSVNDAQDKINVLLDK